MCRALFCAATLLLAAQAQAASGVYKWVDRAGITRYDDHSLLAERLTRASISRGLVSADAKATVPAELVNAVAQQCSDIKERSASYASARAVYGHDPIGNQYRLSDYQLALEIARLKGETRRYCRPLAAQHLMAEAQAELRQPDAAVKTGPPAP